jgi:predicted nucleotidyltransferase/DNA-binding XRE family transcriptional regulator
VETTTEGRGAALRAARAAAGLTQKDLAGRLGIAAPNIAAYESGKRALSQELFDRILGATRPLPSTTLRAHAGQIRELAARHGAESVSVFGSVARGEDRYDSDIDLLMSFRPGTDLFDVAELNAELEALLGTKVDIVSVGGLTSRDSHVLAEAVAL